MMKPPSLAHAQRRYGHRMLIEHAVSLRRDVSGRLHPWMQEHRTSGRFKYITFGRCCQGGERKRQGVRGVPRKTASNCAKRKVLRSCWRERSDRKQLRKTHVLRSCEATHGRRESALCRQRAGGPWHADRQGNAAKVARGRSPRAGLSLS